MHITQGWTMPDLAVTSSTGLALIPECRCRIDAADYRPKMPIPDFLFLDIPTFTYDLSITSDMSTSQRNTTTSRLWTCICVILFTTMQQYGGARWTPFILRTAVLVNAGLSAIRSVRNRNEKSCRFRNQSGTEIRRLCPVQECSGTGLRCRFLECRYRRHKP